MLCLNSEMTDHLYFTCVQSKHYYKKASKWYQSKAAGIKLSATIIAVPHSFDERNIDIENKIDSFSFILEVIKQNKL